MYHHIWLEIFVMTSLLPSVPFAQEDTFALSPPDRFLDSHAENIYAHNSSEGNLL